MIEYEVWWIPQVPLRDGDKPFTVTVPDLDTGKLMVDTLAQYDLYQFHNNIKPDYSNAGGLQYRINGGEWEEVDVDDDDELDYHRSEVARIKGSAARG